MAVQNITLYRNTTTDMTYTHVEAMTGGTLYFTIKEAQWDTDADDSDAIVTKDVTSFVDGIVDGVTVAGAKAEWQVTDADTYIDPGKYYYDIVYEDADGESTPPIFEGKLTIKPHPTNRSV